MIVRHHKRSDYRTMPWKNGKGSTLELGIWPEGASLERGDFQWRVSRASIAEPGPFSTFPDYDRALALWRGQELRLRDAGGTLTQLLRPGQVFRFRGDVVLESQLPKGPVQDFNVFTRREQAEATLEVLDLDHAGVRRNLEDGMHFLVCAEGQATVDLDGQSYHSSHQLLTEESLFIDARQSAERIIPLISLLSLVPGTRIFWVRIDLLV